MVTILAYLVAALVRPKLGLEKSASNRFTGSQLSSSRVLVSYLTIFAPSFRGQLTQNVSDFVFFFALIKLLKFVLGEVRSRKLYARAGRAFLGD